MIRSLTLRCGLLGVAIAAAGAIGCGGEGPEGRQTVYGKVTLDGQPLARGEIAFDPDPDGSGGATVSTGGVIVDGSYSISGEDGPTAGKYRVSIRSGGGRRPTPRPLQACPRRRRRRKGIRSPRYNTDSTLTAEIKPNGSTSADFELTSEPGK